MNKNEMECGKSSNKMNYSLQNICKGNSSFKFEPNKDILYKHILVILILSKKS